LSAVDQATVAILSVASADTDRSLASDTSSGHSLDVSRTVEVLASYRSPVHRNLGWALGLWFLGIGLVLVVALGSGQDMGDALAIGVVSSALNLSIAAYLLLWFARVGAYITADGVRVIRMTRSIEIPWAEHPNSPCVHASSWMPYTWSDRTFRRCGSMASVDVGTGGSRVSSMSDFMWTFKR
jgi:hypothetical protein